ncbi:MAG: hypothetical protein AAF297_01500 [Planctomycetota bacterium]
MPRRLRTCLTALAFTDSFRARPGLADDARRRAIEGIGTVLDAIIRATMCVRGLLLAAVLAGLSVSPAHGQLVAIDEELARAVTISGEGRGRIDAFVGRHRERLMSDDRTDVVTARAALSEPLADTRVSVAFRQALASALETELQTLAGSDESWRRLVGLRLAADLATENTARLIDAAVDADEPEVRYFAMFAIETIFDTVAGSSAAVTDRTLNRLLEHAGTAVSETEDPRYADAAIRAIGAAATIPDGRIAGLAPRAIGVLADATSALTRRSPAIKADATSALPLIRGGLIVRNYVAANDELPREVALQTIGFGGDLVAFVFARTEQAGGVDDAEPIDFQLAGIGASLVFFGEQARARATRDQPRVGQVDLVTPMRDGDLANFRSRVLSLVGDAGALRRAPLSFPGERFDRDN